MPAVAAPAYACPVAATPGVGEALFGEFVLGYAFKFVYIWCYIVKGSSIYI